MYGDGVNYFLLGAAVGNKQDAIRSRWHAADNARHANYNAAAARDATEKSEALAADNKRLARSNDRLRAEIVQYERILSELKRRGALELLTQ